MPSIYETNGNMSQWYNHAVYNRYWEQYWMIKDWIRYCRRSHEVAKCRAFREATPVSPAQCFYSSNHHFHHRKVSSSHCTHTLPKQHRHYASFQSKVPRNSLKRKSGKPPVAESFSETSVPEDSESEFDFVFSEEWIQHITQTMKFRLERDAKKKAEQLLNRKKKFDETGPPSKMKKYMKDMEMKEMYGDSAAKIRGMEVAMQLSFERYFDAKKPYEWPVLPLKM